MIPVDHPSGCRAANDATNQPDPPIPETKLADYTGPASMNFQDDNASPLWR